MTSLKTTALIAAIVAGMGLAAANAAPRGGADRPAFAELDTNGDGKITSAEIDAFKAARLAKLDSDGNGEISAEEMAAAAQTRKAERMIKRLDKDRDGVLQTDELPQPRDPMVMMDSNNDGEISAEEFAAHEERAKERMEKRGDRKGPGGDRDGKGPRGDHGPRGHGPRHNG